MKAAAEIYKGIEFVRIFSLPDEQKVLIWQSLDRSKIIKILRENTLLNDCIQYQDYLSWYRETIDGEQPALHALIKTPKTLSSVLKEAS